MLKYNIVYNIRNRVMALHVSMETHCGVIGRNNRHYVIVISGDVFSMLDFSLISSRSKLVIYMHSL
jgi:hypothetical protein